MRFIILRKTSKYGLIRHVARTLARGNFAPRYLWCLVAGLFLISTFALVQDANASTNRVTTTVLDVKRAPMPAPTPYHQNVMSTVRHNTPTGPIYKTITTSVPVATIRQEAVRAFARGARHPGLLIAVTAAGLLIDSDTGQIVQEVPQPDAVTGYDNLPSSLREQMEDTTGGFSAVTPNADTQCSSYSGSFGDRIDDRGSLQSGSSSPMITGSYGAQSPCIGIVFEFQDGFFAGSTQHLRYYPGGGPHAWLDMNQDPTTTEEVPESELDQLDPHVPPELFDEIMNDPETDWKDDSPTDLNSEFPLAPEVRQDIQNEHDREQAKADGDPDPDPDSESQPSESGDIIVDQLLDGNVPSFPDKEWEFETEEIDQLPDWDAGLGEGSCPAPVTISLPWSSETIEFSYDPACDLAGMIRPFVISTAGFFGLLIVLRRG